MLNNLLFLCAAFSLVAITHYAYRHSKEALLCLMIVEAVLGNILALKQITLFGLNACASEIFIVASLYGMQAFHRRYGEQAALKALSALAFSLVFVILSTQFHRWLTPNDFDFAHAHYDAIFNATPRIMLASLICLTASQWLNVTLLTRWISDRLSAPTRFLRQTGIILLCQAMDTVCFTMLAFSGVLDALHELMLVSFTLKAMTTLILGLPTYFTLRARHD